MCGICGELSFSQQQPERHHIELMLQTLKRRGPDAEGVYEDRGIALGHRRLAIIDLSSRSHQPMVDHSLFLTIVFNGTIYNYRELRTQLQEKGYSFFSSGDTEVILKAYAEWGDACVNHFIGMFAFAIWDSRRRELFMARDRLGIKPLYYNLSPTGLRFASNVQALLKYTDVDRSIDPIALHHHLTLHAVVPAPRTLLQGVRKLPPATWMRVLPDGSCQSGEYWSLNQLGEITDKSADQWQEEIHQALKLAVKRRLDAADVPVGVLLSGGLDSSLLVALLAEQNVQDLHTFSVGFEDQPEESGNEFFYSDQVVARYQTLHKKFVIPNSEVLKTLPDCIANMSEPMVGQDAVAFYLLSQRVSQDIKVVQSGQGADEVFGGYFWYPLIHQEKTGTAVERFAKYYFDRSHEEFLETVSPAFHGLDHTRALVEERLNAYHDVELLQAVLRFDVSTLIVDDPVKRVDNMTMAWGLEARVPFLDHELVELAAQMPISLKLASGGKHILKNIARTLLPATVVDRPKGYFPMPALKYVRGEFLHWMKRILLSEACRNRGLFNPQYVAKLLADPSAYLTTIKGNKLWHLALLEAWLQHHVDT